MKISQISIFKLPKKNLNAYQQIMLLENLTSLLSNGFTLLECFNFINLYFKYKDKQLDTKIIKNIKNGMTCSEILKLIGYPHSIITQIFFAQKYGHIDNALKESIQYLKINVNAKQQIIKTIQYPLILIIIFLSMILLLNYTVLPQFETLYTTINVNLTLFQRILTHIISTLPASIFTFIISLILISATLSIIYTKYDTAKKIKLLTHIPILNIYFKIIKTYQVSTDLALFYKNGINLQDIVKIYTQQDNDFLQYLGRQLLASTNNGLSLADSLDKIPCFQKDLINFISQGEKSGKLDVELTIYSQILIKRFQDTVIKHTKIIQPLVFFFLGFFIISLYLVIMLPMFQLMQNIK